MGTEQALDFERLLRENDYIYQAFYELEWYLGPGKYDRPLHQALMDDQKFEDACTKSTSNKEYSENSGKHVKNLLQARRKEILKKTFGGTWEETKEPSGSKLGKLCGKTGGFGCGERSRWYYENSIQKKVYCAECVVKMVCEKSRRRRLGV